VSKEKISRGEARHRRLEISKGRSGYIPDRRRQMAEKLHAMERLVKVEEQLTPEKLMLLTGTKLQKEQIKASLEIERLWLQLKCGVINKERHEKLLSGKFNELSTTMPDVYNYFIQMEDGITRAQKIRYSVIPEIKVAGFHTTK